MNGLNNSVGLDTSPQYPTNIASTETDISSAFIATGGSTPKSAIGDAAKLESFPINNTTLNN